jgi:medium-chain acyl-[acyl-carrier-protein] hydrolase
MDEIYKLNHKVGYFQVDHQHRIQLGSLFKLLQEAAIHHANQAEIGTQIMTKKGESWVLNRVAMKLSRYPRFDESITIQTWATSLKQFKGFREFRILTGDEIIGQVSTLWLYINMEKKAFTRLPFEVEESFPIRPDHSYYPRLDKLRLPKPDKESIRTQVSLRYGDIDGNLHVNNAAYMEMLQTGLYNQNLDTRPKILEIQFAKEIPPDAGQVEVRFQSLAEETRFSLGTSEEVAAFGRLL